MKPLTDKTEWPKLAVYDIEAENWTDVVLIGHIDEYGNRVVFKSIPSYLNWLFHDFPGEHVWAHWGGHYDHRFVIHYATIMGWEWETIISGNLIIILTVRHSSGRKIRFCESSRLMPDSVERIGKTVGLKKLDVDRSKIQNLTQDELVEYCLRDCEIVLKGLQYLKEALTSIGADFAYTLASISSRWVRRSDILEWHRFYDKTDSGLKYSKRMLESDNFCLEAYFGGRVEVFKLGTFKKKLYYYDIRSSYPWSMLHDLPTYPKGFQPPTGGRIDKDLQKSGVSEATVTVPQDTYLPLLCVRHKGKLIFPIGTFRGRWTNLELWEAYKRGVKVEIHGQCLYEPFAFLRPFVNSFYSLRQKALNDGDEFRSYAYKIALNSLYGKLIETIDRVSIIFGSRNVSRALRLYGHFDPNKKQTAFVKATQTPGIYAVVSQMEGPFRHVAAGAYVTARSRIRLLEGMELALKEGGQIYYCDTDSIVTDIRLPETHDLFGDTLGSFKLEAELVEAEFINPKVYRAITVDGKSIYKVKGIPVKGLTDEESLDRWNTYIAGNEVGKEGITGFATDLRHGRIKPEKMTLVRSLKHSDSKRLHENQVSKPIFYTGPIVK